MLTEQQKDDLGKTESECEFKLIETKALLQETLWTRYGDMEMSTSLHVAQAESERVAAVIEDGNHKAYDYMLTHL